MVNLLEDILALWGYEDCRKPSLGYSCWGLKKEFQHTSNTLKEKWAWITGNVAAADKSVTPQSFLPCSKCHSISHTFLNTKWILQLTILSQTDTVFPEYAVLICLAPCYTECHSGVLASDSNINLLHILSWFHFTGSMANNNVGNSKLSIQGRLKM